MGLYDNVERMWFGTEQKMGWIETPQTGADVSSIGQSASSVLQNGGGNVRNSWDSHKVYQFSWGDSAPPSLVSLLQAYRNGSYGRGFLYFHDPMHYATNLLPKRWADPSMAANFEGEPLIPDVWPEVSPVVSTAANYPVTEATYAVPANYSSEQNGSEHFIPIPDGMTLVLGAVYRGDASLYVRTNSGATVLAPMSTADGTVVNTVIRNRPWARIGIRKAGVAGTISITGMTARLVDTVPNADGVAFSYRNIATHGTFEVPSGTIEMKRNRHTNPDLLSNTDGYGHFGGSALLTVARTVLPVGELNLTRPGAVATFTATADGIASALLGDAIPVTAGEVITATFYVRRGAGWTGTLTPRLDWSNGARVTSPAVAMAQTQYDRYRITATVPEGVTTARLNGLVSQMAIGNTFRVRMAQIETGSVPTEYIDGSGATTVDPDITASWVGVVNNSASVLTARGAGPYNTPTTVAYGIRSSQTGTGFSLRQIPLFSVRNSAYTEIANASTPRGHVAGQTYTAVVDFFQFAPQGFTVANSRSVSVTATDPQYAVSVAANDVSGTQQMRLTYRIPPTGDWSLRLYNGGMLGDPSTWWDNLTIVAGNYAGPSFSGDSAFAVWTGTPNESDSLWEGRTPISGEIGMIPWMSGEGHSGCRFQGNPTVINYNGVGGGQIGLSAIFTEVGAWE